METTGLKRKINTWAAFFLIAFFASGASAAIILTAKADGTAEQVAGTMLRLPVQPRGPDKNIFISLKDQMLTYTEDMRIIGQFRISSGLARTPTPPGEYTVLKKKPVVNYRGPDYNYPATKWNLMFKEGKNGNYYIHGAYWHNNFGYPMSHGCINVSYANMEALYNWAEEGTKITIEQ
jgi:hypothetical protein